jgi:chaperonin GroEL
VPRSDPRNIVIGTEAREKLLEGARKLNDAVAVTYGPTSGNVSLQRSYGTATNTKDGVTVAKNVFLRDEIEDMGAGMLVQASEKSNDISGDGTSATVILAYHIMRLAHQRIAAGFNPMALKRGIDKAAYWVKGELDTLSTPIKDKDLHEVASISASDPEIGKLVADTIIQVKGVGITVEEYDGLGIIQEMVNGVYFEKGYTQPHFASRDTEEAVLENADVLILEKRISSEKDIIPILEMVSKVSQHKKLLIIGNVSGKALETCILTHIHPNGVVDICVVDPPVYGDQVLPFLEDMAAVTGGSIVQSSMAANQVTYEMLGHAAKVIITKDSTTIFEGAGDIIQVESRINVLEQQLKSDKYNAFQKERMEMRLAKLQGKIGIIKVGGATETERTELKFRVDDAICATRAAREEGIVPGGATTLARLSKTDWLNSAKDLSKADEEEGSRVVLDALAEPFKQLMENAGLDGGSRLEKVLDSSEGHGFNVKDVTDKPIDLMKAKIFDPTKVLKSVVENACSAAGTAIITKATITYDREYQLEQVMMTKARQ